MKFGLSEETLQRVCLALKKSSKIQHAYIFGSRALGTHRPGSDIDIAVEGNELTLDDILSIRLSLENLLLPYRYDVVDMKKADGDLLEHIRRVGVLIC